MTEKQPRCIATSDVTEITKISQFLLVRKHILVL